MSDMVYKQNVIDEMYNTFSYAYCDNCENEMDEDRCGDCHRKYNNWAASKSTIERAINGLPSAEPHWIPVFSYRRQWRCTVA